MLHRIPAELLICIAEHLSSSQDINALARSCRRTYKSCNKFLYQHDASYVVLKSAVKGNQDHLRRGIGYGLSVNVTEPVGENTPLLLATRFRHIECVKILLAIDGIDLTSKDSAQHRTAIQWATAANDVEMLRIFLDHPSLRSEVASEALWTAVEDHRPFLGKPLETMKLLIQHDNIDLNTIFHAGQTALARVTERGDVNMQDLLIAADRVDLNCRVWIKAGALINMNPVPLKILRDGDEDLADRLFMNHRHRIDFEAETWDGNNALHISVKRLRVWHCEILLRECPGLLHRQNAHGNTPFFSVIKALCDMDRRVAITPEKKAAKRQIWHMFLDQPDMDYYVRNETGSTLLLEAAKYGGLDLFINLLRKTEPAQIHDPNTNGDTPVSNAASNGHIDILQYLLERGADANNRNKQKRTPLMLAIRSHNTPAVETLLSHGTTNVNARGENGMTALMCAANTYNLEAAERLLEKPDVDVNVRDESGWTALTWATSPCWNGSYPKSQRKARRRYIKKALLQHGAVRSWWFSFRCTFSRRFPRNRLGHSLDMWKY